MSIKLTPALTRLPNWHFYRVNAIDYAWEMLPSVHKVAKLILEDEFGEDMLGSDYTIDRFMTVYHQVLVEAKQRGWEGDFRHGEANVFFLPDDTEFSYAFVWKQENNGDTFVASPHALPWLEMYGERI